MRTTLMVTKFQNNTFYVGKIKMIQFNLGKEQPFSPLISMHERKKGKAKEYFSPLQKKEKDSSILLK